MGRINILSREITDKIAAGEVVERPASAVKELLENSLDAGARSLRVEVENAGRGVIRVIDDGEGMTGDDVKLACRRHATSKIKSADDLHDINTLGFRGEALSSIAAVSILTIVSRNRSEASGWTVRIEGGVIKDVKQTAHAGGTTVEVRNLFFNTPARLKFLKSNSTEMFHIVRVVTELALAYPLVAFELKHNRDEIINLAPHEDLRERVCLLLGEDLEGELISISGERALLKIGGLVTRPGSGRSGRGEQFFFVNSRPVSNRTIAHAVTQAYHTFLPEKHFPPVAIFIEISPRSVDVNVHPRKREVKFRHHGVVHDAVVETMREALTRKDYLPGLTTAGAAAEGTGVKEAGTEFMPASSAPAGTADVETKVLSPGLFAGEAKDFQPPESFFSKETAGQADGDHLQIKNTYLVSQDEEGVVIIDQHAAHERILFDKLLSQFREKAVEKQKMLIPLTLNLGRAETLLMEEHKETVRKLGFDIEEFGTNTFIVHSYPAALGGIDPVNVIKFALEEIAEVELSADMEKRITQLLAPIACHSAIRAGNRLTPEEISSLVKRLRKTSAPYTCPHGRPTVVKITWLELEKKFRRK